MSLRWRLALGLGLITALVIGFVGVGAYLAVADRLETSVDESLRERADEVVKAYEDNREHEPRPGAQTVPTNPNSATQVAQSGDDDDYPFTRPTQCPPAGAMQPAAGAQVVDAEGTVTVCIEGGVELPVDKADVRLASARTGGTELRTETIDGHRYRVFTVSRSDGSALQIARGLGEVDDVLDSMQRWLIGIGIAGVGAAVLLGWLMARRTVRPVERLRATAERIAATQDLAVEVPVGGPTEIASLGRSFTTMVDALGTSRREQQRLVSDASHELRTPLTSLRTNAELLARADRLTPEQQAAVVEGIELEVDELTHLVTELVELATDRSDDNEPLEWVDLGTLARDVALRAERRSGRTVTVTVVAGDEPATVNVRPQMLTRAISNLIDNALKYSAAPAPVEVVVTGTSVEVRDEGPGIPEADQPHVFDRFYRSDTARTEPGSGLGLAIVKQAVERHGGTVWAANRDGGHGASVGFRL
jgi:two-component system sensor histidine kinase MprB